MTYGTPEPPPASNVMRCPKCHGSMRTYNRNGVQIEQCDTCRGVFLDFGELESLTQLEARFTQQAHPPQAAYAPPPAAYGPGWGHHGHHQYRSGGFARLFFSS